MGVRMWESKDLKKMRRGREEGWMGIRGDLQRGNFFFSFFPFFFGSDLMGLAQCWKMGGDDRDESGREEGFFGVFFLP